MLSKNNQTPQHYLGPPTSASFLLGALGPLQPAINSTEPLQPANNSIEPLQPTNISTEPLQNAHNPAGQNQFSHCPPRLCLYRRGSNECGQSISCNTAPKHFADVHNIKGMARNVPIFCEWRSCGKQVLRNNFIRHVREAHMGHERNQGN